MLGALPWTHYEVFDPKAPQDMYLQRKSWQSVFDSFGVACNTLGVSSTLPQKGFERLIVVPKAITLETIIAIMRLMFKVRVYTDCIDGSIVHDERSNHEDAYAVFASHQQEAPVAYANHSANCLASLGVLGITLKERLLFEILHFIETGVHLDNENITLCSGSRTATGFVPCVDFNNLEKQVEIYCCVPSDKYHPLRVRTVLR